jgi:hypothetical protein
MRFCRYHFLFAGFASLLFMGCGSSGPVKSEPVGPTAEEAIERNKDSAVRSAIKIHINNRVKETAFASEQANKEIDALARLAKTLKKSIADGKAYGKSLSELELIEVRFKEATKQHRSAVKASGGKAAAARNLAAKWKTLSRKFAYSKVRPFWRIIKYRAAKTGKKPTVRISNLEVIFEKHTDLLGDKVVKFQLTWMRRMRATAAIHRAGSKRTGENPRGSRFRADWELRKVQLQADK